MMEVLMDHIVDQKAYTFFAHKECEFFPCHPGADPDNFNCLFCYCPLYALGDRCGGSFRYKEVPVQSSGGDSADSPAPESYTAIKDCSACLFPHLRENYGQVIHKCRQIVRAAGSQKDPV